MFDKHDQIRQPGALGLSDIQSPWLPVTDSCLLIWRLTQRSGGSPGLESRTVRPRNESHRGSVASAPKYRGCRRQKLPGCRNLPVAAHPKWPKLSEATRTCHIRFHRTGCPGRSDYWCSSYLYLPDYYRWTYGDSFKLT